MKLIAYYRVSTDKQKRSGLGLAAQRQDVERHAQVTGGTVTAEYTEAETGKANDRPELLKALAHARKVKGTLVIAKLDRLSRNSAFVNNLLEAGVPFVCCDNPQATPLTIRILAAIAQDEAERISARTKAGLQVIKRRIAREGSYTSRSGRVITKLGADGFAGDPQAAQRRSLKVRRQQSQKKLAPASFRAQALRQEGLTMQQIANTLNAEGYTTSRGLEWGSGQVCRLLG